MKKICTYMDVLRTLKIIAGHGAVLHGGTVPHTTWGPATPDPCSMNVTIFSNPVTTKTSLQGKALLSSHLGNHYPKD